LPTAAEVVETRFVPNRNYRPGLWPDVTLTRPEAIREVVEWLHAVDWSAAPSDLTRIDVPPLSELRLTKRDGTKVSYAVYRPCIVVGNQVWRADTDRLVLLLQKGAAEFGAADDRGGM
jgi:hypothetical protein